MIIYQNIEIDICHAGIYRLTDETRFSLSDDSLEKFQADLNAPAVPTADLVELMVTATTWEFDDK